ncbi:hypothetical protein ACFQ0B_76110 [Nonomuraea thailandensis]
MALLVGATVWGDSTWLLQDLDKLPTLAEQVSARSRRCGPRWRPVPVSAPR